MGIVLKNNARTTLSAGISSTDTTIYVSSTDSFPALGVGEYFYCTIESTTGAYEIVKVTQVNSSSFDVTRAQENTVAIPFNIGARVELRITVQSLQDFFGDQVTDGVTSYNTVTAFTSGDATPSVAGGKEFSTTGSTTITNLDDGYDGQIVTIYRGAADITIQHNANIVLTEGLDIVLRVYRPSIKLRNDGGVWYQEFDAGLGRITLAPGDDIPWRWRFGANAATSYPGFMIGGPSRGGFQARFGSFCDAGDTVDLATSSTGGTPASPSNWTGFCPHTTIYDWSPQVTQTKPVNNTTYIGRHWQIYGGQTQTPADGALGGWVGIGCTNDNDTVPWLRAWFSGGNSDGVGLVIPGRSNVPGKEARATDGGTLLTAPYTYSNLQNIFSAGVVNPKGIPAQGNLHLIASSNSSTFAVTAIRFSDALGYGFDWTTNHTNDSLILLPVASAARGSNGIEFTSSGGMRAFVDNTSALGGSSNRFSAVHAVDAQVSTVNIGHASDTTLSRASAGVLQVESDPIMTRGVAETITGVKTFATNTLTVVDSSFKATNDGSDCRWLYDTGDYIEYNRANNRFRTVIGGSVVEEKTASAHTETTSHVILSGTAIPAGGTAGAGYKMSSTSNFGVFFGSGAPTLSAAKGSLYLRSDGSTTNDRAYINTNGSTTWTALTTAA